MKNTLRILLVEDNGSDAGVTEELLRRADSAYEVVHVARLSDAMVKLHEWSAAAVLLDLNLADSQGIDTIIALRSFTSDVPIIVLTGEDDKDIMREAARLGAQDYLIKARLNAPLLEKAIQYAIERKSVEQDLQHQKEFYERLLDDAGVWVEATDREGNVILWNKGAERISGYRKGEVLGGRQKWELLYPDQDYRQEMMERYHAMIEKAETVRGLESQVVRSDGSSRTISWTSNLIRDIEGGITGTMLVGSDVTEEKQSHFALERNKDKYRVLSELTSDYAYSATIDKEGNICMMWVAGAFQQITSYRHEDILGRENAWLTVVEAEDRHLFLDLAKRCQREEPSTLEYRILKRDGSVTWIEDHIQPVRNVETGAVDTIHGAVKDITDRKIAEQALRESENKFRQLIEGIRESFLMESLDGSRVLYVNPGFTRVWGHSSNVLHRDPVAWLAFVHPEDRDRVEEAYRNGRSDGSYAEEYRITRSDGATRWVWDKRQILFNDKGEAFGVAGISEDITRRKEAEDALQEKEDLFRRLIESSYDGVTLTDESGVIRDWNKGQESLTGISGKEAVGRYIWEVQFELVPEELKSTITLEAIRTITLEFFRSGSAEWQGKPIEQWIRRPDGGRRCLEIVVFPVRTSAGFMAGSISRDITSFDSDRTQLEELNTRLRALLDAIPDQVYFKDTEGRILLVNEAVIRFTGKTGDELLGRTVDWFSGAGGTDDSAELDNRTIRDGVMQCTEEIHLGEDGHSTMFETIRVPMYDVHREITGMVAVSRDVSERKIADVMRTQSERQIRALIGAIPDALYEIGRDGIVRHYKKPMQGEALHDEGSTHGRNVDDLFPVEVARVLKHHTRVALDTCFTQRFEFQIYHRRNHDTRHYEARLTASTGENVLMILRDITEARTTAELLEQQNEELRSRNEELDTFTHMVAHDLKNPLSLMLGYAELVRSDSGGIDDAALRDYMDSIIFSGRKMTAIIQELLLLASVRKEEIQFTTLDMERTVHDALRRLDELIQRRQTTIVLPQHWESALGYSPWIEEVWVNYIGNAIKHGAPGRRVELGVSREGTMLRFWVRDDGPGIPAEERDRLFLPFMRLTQVKIEGHGLGLSIVRRIVEKLGGTVDVESQIGKGSSFSFTLPAAE